MSRPDHPKKFPKIVNTQDEVVVVTRNSRIKKTHSLDDKTTVELDKKGRIVQVSIKK